MIVSKFLYHFVSLFIRDLVLGTQSKVLHQFYYCIMAFIMLDESPCSVMGGSGL